MHNEDAAKALNTVTHLPGALCNRATFSYRSLSQACRQVRQEFLPRDSYSIDVLVSLRGHLEIDLESGHDAPIRDGNVLPLFKVVLKARNLDATWLRADQGVSTLDYFVDLWLMLQLAQTAFFLDRQDKLSYKRFRGNAARSMLLTVKEWGRPELIV